MRIVAIEPRAPGLHIFTQAYAPRVGLPRLLTQAQNMGHECVIFCEEVKESQVDWEMVAKADLVMISSTTSTAPRAYDLARRARQVNSRAPILGGGPHFTFEYQEALRNGIDYVFCHWADTSFFQWLKWYEDLADPQNICEDELSGLSDINGLAFMVAGLPHKTRLPEEVDPDSWPTPDFRLVHGYKPKFIVLITSEGCDHNCAFCSEWRMHGARYRSRSPEKVIEDIRFYRQVYGQIPIMFGDDNMAADVKSDDRRTVLMKGHERLGSLCQMIIEADLVGSYSGQVRLALADHPDLLDLMSEVGFTRVYIGYESINTANAKVTGGKLDFARMREQTAAFHQHGISIHAMWVLGFDEDDLDTVKETIKVAMKWQIATNQFMVLMPLPGSPLRERMIREGRLIEGTPWDKYDGHHVVFYPKKMKTWELQAAVMLKAMPKVYNLGQTLRIYLASNWRTLRRWLAHKAPHPKIEFRSHNITLILRVVGRNVVAKAKGPARKHLQRLRKLGA